MASIHLEFEKEDVAEIVFMPGDPLRAKYIAEKYLTDVVLINQVRNMFGYTGYYKGIRISIIPSGMGIPSMGIYAYELFNYYDVKKIVRLGTCGSMNENIKVGDLLLASSSYSESTFAKIYNNENSKEFKASELLNNSIIVSASKHQINLQVGKIFSTDVFEPYAKNNIINELLPKNEKFIGTEMESFSLFFIASLLKKEATCLLTVSDSPYENISLSQQERQSALDEMIVIALDSLFNL